MLPPEENEKYAALQLKKCKEPVVPAARHDGMFAGLPIFKV